MYPCTASSTHWSWVMFSQFLRKYFSLPAKGRLCFANSMATEGGFMNRKSTMVLSGPLQTEWLNCKDRNFESENKQDQTCLTPRENYWRSCSDRTARPEKSSTTTNTDHMTPSIMGLCVTTSQAALKMDWLHAPISYPSSHHQHKVCCLYCLTHCLMKDFGSHDQKSGHAFTFFSITLAAHICIVSDYGLQ